MDDVDVLRAVADRVPAIVAELSEDDLGRPTPCPEWDVRALLQHWVGAQHGLLAMLRGDEPDWTADRLGDEPVRALQRCAGEVLEAWAQPGAVDVPSTQMPGMRVVDFAVADAVVHTWDLATALQRPFDLPDDVVQRPYDRWSGEAAETGRTYGAFGPAVTVAEDRPLLERFVGLLGRDPEWRPPVV